MALTKDTVMGHEVVVSHDALTNMRKAKTNGPGIPLEALGKNKEEALKGIEAALVRRKALLEGDSD